MKSFTKVVLKMISFCVMLRSLTFIQGLVMFLVNGSRSPDLILNVTYVAFSFLSCLILGVLIWVLADKISLHIVQKDEEGFNMNLPIKPLLRAAIVVLGIYILANTIPSIIGNVYQYISIQNQIKDHVALSGFNGFLQVKSAIITDFIKIIIAIFIIAGHKWLVNFTEYLKVDEKQDQDENNNMDKNAS